MKIGLLAFSLILGTTFSELQIPLEQLSVSASLNPSHSECEPFLSDTLLLFVCSGRSPMEIGFYYFDRPPTLRNDHVLHVSSCTHVQINNERAALTVNLTNGFNGVYVFEYKADFMTTP